MKKKIICIAIAILICALGFIGYAVGYQKIAQNRRYPDMEKNLDKIEGANICVISKTCHDDMEGYSAGASGFIFAKDDNGYYALTANHVVEKGNTQLETENTQFIVMTEKDCTLSEYRKEHPKMKITSPGEYYDKLSKADVVYQNEKCDLAIIHFEYKDDLKCVSIAKNNSKKSDKIVSVGINGDKMEYFVKTYGKVTQSETSVFHTEDNLADNEVQKHSAYETSGFSGGGVFNQDMEIVGMNIGAAVNGFGRFSYGVMIPCEQINECIKESGVLN